MSIIKKNSTTTVYEEEIDELLSLLSTCDEYRKSFETDPASSLRNLLGNQSSGHQNNNHFSHFIGEESPTLAAKDKISNVLNAYRSKSSNEFAMLPIQLNIEKKEGLTLRKTQPA